ncbi:MAG: helix-hairpin-helix domain-containing protein [Peptococcaceae bacterium]|nr:helix-hairpin-helix domain-containing protein [Peptococcaceae bacterium]
MDRKLKLVWLGVLGILLVAAALKFLLPVKSPPNMELTQESREIVVYVTGAVKNSGLYTLPLDSRLDDVLKLAVLTAEADQELLNPAQRLKDGQKIIVPYKIIDEGQESDSAGSTNGNQAKQGTVNSGNRSGKVNINNAGLAELDTIPGIGPVLAQRIIDYREQNGLFSSPEEIQNVSGIGPKTYEKMADYITIGY